MLQFRRTFESDKHQLQELNNRLAQYLSRAKLLEQENAGLIAEINQLRRQQTTAEWEQQCKAEVRDLRRTVAQLASEKSLAEMETEKRWRELQMLQSLRSQESEVCRGIGGELQGCEKELHRSHQTNLALEQRLVHLEEEYNRLEDAHRQEMAHLRRQLDSRVVPTIAHRGPPAVSLEEVQEYARCLSEGWSDTFDMYQRKAEDMEQSIKADQARLEELQREKMRYAANLDTMRAEAEKQGKIQIRLEEQLVHMQDRFRVDFTEYQMLIEQLERERSMLADSIAEKLQEHQQLLQVKMDLGMEVAAYRALLEGERVDLQEAHRRVNQHHQRERIIDIKMPSHPYTPRAFTSPRQRMDVRYTEQTSNLRGSPVPLSGSISPSRVIPISVTGRAQHQSPASRRDMVSFTKARAEAAASATTTEDKHVAQHENQSSQDVQKKAEEEKSVIISQPEKQFHPIISSTAHSKSVRVVSPPMMSLSNNTEADSQIKMSDEKEEGGNSYDSDFIEDKGTFESTTEPSEKNILKSVSVEEMIEKLMKPAGVDAKESSSGESKITYHVEKTEQEDGTTKTQIVLESKVEEELDLSEDSAMDEFLSRGAKKISLEDIKDTATGSIIQNLISSLQEGENMENKSVNVEIIEEPVESHSDEEYDVEQKSMSSFLQPSSAYFQIEELENVPHDSTVYKSDDDTAKPLLTEEDFGMGGSVHVQEVPRDRASPYFSYGQELHEYFVSTPDDNLSEPEEGGGITSYGHYGVVDDLSDERYYQDEGLLPNRMIAEEVDEYKFMSSDLSFVKESFPECIIEEEIHVPPTVQRSVLDILREESQDPKEQLKGALEKIKGSVSGPLKDEFDFLTKVSSDSPQNLVVNVKEVQQSSDNGTTTIVAELNVSQTLEDSGLLEAEGDDLSEEQIVAALQSSNPELEKALQSGTGGGYSLRVSRDQDVTQSEGLQGFTTKVEAVTNITEWHTQLGPSEKSFTFQMDVNNSQAQSSSEQVLQSQILDTQLKVSHEKRGATVYLESPADDY